jgi:hypothetical protein
VIFSSARMTAATTTRIASRRGWRCACAVLAFMLCAGTGRAQDVTESSLKAAFIYNFAKFTVWPQDAPTTVGASRAPVSFNACVLGDSRLRDDLERTVRDRQLSGRGIIVSQVQLDGKLGSCHLLFVSGVTSKQVEAIVAALQGTPVLTISDVDDFARHGGIIQMFVDNGKLRFNFNLAAAKQSRLQLSSKLLILAAHVDDGPKAAGP